MENKEQDEIIKDLRKCCKESIFLNQKLIWEMKRTLVETLLWMVLLFAMGMLTGINIMR